MKTMSTALFTKMMETRFFVTVLILLGCLFNTVHVNATHLAGADLTYKRLTGNTYEFTLSLIRDCDGVAAPNSVVLSYSSTSCNISSTVTLNPIQGTGQEITFPCGNVQTECTGGTEPGYQQWVYKGTANLAACSNWVFSYQICCRNCDINTITHVGNCGTDMYVEATLNNVAGVNNSSPSFTNLPVAFLCLNQNFNYNHGAIDLDGDSLSYSFISPKVSSSTNVSFLPGYSSSNFLTSSTAILINSASGEVNFTPSNLTEVGITSIRVQEYRNGVLIGSVTRDFQFRIKDCYPNVIPTVTGINGTNNTTAYACPGSQTCFNVLSNDSNAGQVVTMNWNNGIPTATFTTAGSPFPTGTFCWTPTLADIRPQPYTFTVSVFDNNCPINGFQVRSFSIYVTPPQPVITGDSLFCQGYTGTLDAGQGYVSYLWSTGATTQQIPVTSSGTYVVTVSDANGCTGSASKLVATYNAPSCSISGVSGFCDGSSAQLCAATNSSYAWSTGATTQCITITTGGTYTVTVTNANGCTSSCSKTVTAFTPPSCNITGSLFYCQGSSTQICADAGFSSYLWNTGATTQCVTVTAGNYTVTVTDANGCSSSCTTVVTAGPLPFCSVTGSSSICQGGSVQWCAASAPNGFSYSYLWSTGATTQCISLNTAGTRTVTITDQFGCTKVCSKTLTVNQLPVCSVTGSNFCQGSSTQLCAATNSSYLWNTGATTQCITVSTGGTYTVTATNGSGCTSSCSKTVIAYTPPSCTITGDFFYCQGSATQICAPAGLVYIWNTGATTQCITVTAGNYSVTITDGNGCTSSCSATVTERPNPNCIITGTSSVCSGGSVQWCAASAPNGFSYSYLWSTGATTQCISLNTAGTRTVTITDQYGCSSSCSKTFTVNQLPVCSVTGGNFCQGSSTQLCAATNSSYLWSTGATTQCITVSTGGTYSVTATNGNGCTSSCSKTVIAYTPPSCSITGSSSVCSGGSTQWCAPAGLSGYLWSTGATTQCITVSQANTYSLTVTDANGCTSNCSKTLTVNPAGNSTITGSGAVCAGNSTQWCAPAGLSSYLWSTGATTQCITVSAAGTYSVTTTNGNGCISNSSKTLTINPLPNCQISGSTTICFGSSVQWCAPAGMASYLWSTGATTQCISLNTAGTYTVTITNNKGCISTCSKTLSVTQAGNSTITGSGSVCAGNSTQWCAPAGLSSYLWSTGATTQCITVSTAGTYSVTTTNGNGCISNSSKTLTINPLPNCHISGSATICFGSSVQWCAPAGMAAYLWSTGATTQCISLNTAGTYTVTITNNKGCISTCSKTLTITQAGNSAITGSGKVCVGSSTQWCGPAGMTSYQWSTGATTQCITLSTGGTYTLTTTNSNGCISSSAKTLSVKPLPVCQITGSSSLCPAGSVTWCATNGMDSYLWSTGATTKCVTFTTAGTRTVTITSKDGCVSTCSKTLTAFQSPTCLITGYTDICQGETTPLCGPAANGNSWLWSTGATTQCIQAGAVGTYTLTVFNQGGCSKSCNVNVTYKTPQSCCSGFRTHTNSDWGANPSGTNAGAYLQQHFAASFPAPDYLTIGCTNKLRLTSAQAVNDFLPSFGPTATLPAGTLINPGAAFVSSLAGHTVALTLSVRFDQTNPAFGSNPILLKDLLVASGPFTGMTVTQVLAEANNKLGGCGSSFTTTQLIDVLSGINSNYNTDPLNDGFLYCPDPSRQSNGFLVAPESENLRVKAYPNPFGSSTTIEFINNGEPSHTRLEIYNTTGSLISVLFDGYVESGELKEVVFHGDQLAEGVYVYRVSTTNNVINGRIVLMRNE